MTPRKIWIVDVASDLAELERRLNHLDEEGFHSLYQILAGFVVIAYRRLWDRWWKASSWWVVVVATAAGVVALSLLRRLLGLPW